MMMADQKKSAPKKSRRRLFARQQSKQARASSNLGLAIVALLGVGVAGPVKLGLGHAVAAGDGLEPGLAGVGATVEVELGVVEELSGLGDVAVVVGLLLGGLLVADGVVLGGGKAGGDVGVGADLALGKVLAAAGTVVVLVGDGGKEVHVKDAGGDGLLLGERGGGAAGLLGGEGGGRADEGGSDDGLSLHGFNYGIDFLQERVKSSAIEFSDASIFGTSTQRFDLLRVRKLGNVSMHC